MIGCMTESNANAQDPVARVNAAWDRIEGLLPEDAFGPAASHEDLDDLEKQLGVTLPDDVRASWSRHGSMEGPPWDGGWIQPPAKIISDWRMWTETEADGGFEGFVEDAEDNADSEGKWFHEAWIPLVHDHGGNHICLDTRTGRYVDMDHEYGSSFLRYTDWAGYLEHTAGMLETKGRPSEH